MPFVSPVDSEAFSNLIWLHLFQTSCSLLWQNPQACMSSLILQCTRLAADKLSFVFLKVALQLKFVVLSLPTDLDLLSVNAPYLPELTPATTPGS